jgi:hypothetical protein
MKTSELTGAALDWAVAKCEGRGIEFEDPRDPWLTRDGISDQPLHSYTPSTDWAQGGPIIEREQIGVFPDATGWVAEQNIFSGCVTNGQTPLIAAMRCYVASKLGDDVDVPEELK